MLAKCSNSSCSASFRFLHSGRLFHFEKRIAHSGPETAATGFCSGVEMFWLCERCAAEFTLVRDAELVARVVPLRAQRFASPHILPGDGTAAAV
jgi:hypothetical protein